MAGTGSVAGQACGNGNDPSSCSGETTMSYVAGYWYKVSGNTTISYSGTTGTATAYSRVNDGSIYSSSASGSVSIDATQVNDFTVTVGTKTTKTVVLTYAPSDSHSGLASVTCVYGTSTSYGTSCGTSTTTASISGLTAGKTYYYQVCATDKVGNTARCKTGNFTAGSTSTAVALGSTRSPSTAQNGYYKSAQLAVTYSSSNVTSPTYYVKTTMAGTGSVAGQACGNSTNPGTCSGETTMSYVAGYWYKVSGNTTISYSGTTGTATAYSRVNDGSIYSSSASGSVSIDATQVNDFTVTVGTKTTKTVVLTYAPSDSHSGLASVTCVYGTSTSYGTSCGTSTTTASISGLTAGKTYYYQVCATDKVGNTARCKTGNFTAGSTSTAVALGSTRSPSTAQNGYYKSAQLAVTYSSSNVTSPTYYVKTTMAGTGSVAGQACGNSTNPGTCSGGTTTSYAANYWYKVSGNTTISYSGTTGTATAYAYVSDGAIYSSSANGSVSIDATSPTLTLGSSTPTASSISVPISAIRDDHSGISSVSCTYGTTSNTQYNCSATTSSASITGLNSSTTYKYRICATDKVSNTASCQTGQATTTAFINGTNGSAITLGGYNWHIIGQDDTKVWLLMDAGQLSNMSHCGSQANSSNNCTYLGDNPSSTVTNYQYSWEKSLIRTYLNGTFYNGLSTEIKNRLVSTQICKDLATEIGVYEQKHYEGYTREESTTLGKTCSSYTTDYVRLITLSEYHNLTPYFKNTTSYPVKVSNEDYAAKVSYITRLSSTDWLYSSTIGYWWTMTFRGPNHSYARLVISNGNSTYFPAEYVSGVRPVIVVKK